METEALFSLKVTFTKDQTPELKGKSVMHLISHILHKEEAFFFFSSDFLIVFCSIPFLGLTCCKKSNHSNQSIRYRF